jgi:two-component system chemotaxis sensor kinase CheA
MIQDEELRNLYKISSEERLQILQEGLQYLQTHPDDEATWAQLRREVHSLKGDSRSVGIDSVETLARGVGEILLSLSRQKIAFTSQVSDRIVQGLAAIEKLVEEAATDCPSGIDPAEVFEQLMLALSLEPELLQETVSGNDNLPQIAASLIEDEELRHLYQSSSEDHLQQLEVGLRYLQTRPDDEATLELLRWEAHSLKGDSRSIGVEPIETLTHCVEKILISLSRKQLVLTEQVSNCLFQALTAIRLLVGEVVTGQASGVDLVGILDPLMVAVLQAEQLQQESVQDIEAEQSVELVEQVFLDEDEGDRRITPIDDNVPVVAADAIAPLGALPEAIEDEELWNLYKTASEERLQVLQDGLRYLQTHPDDEAIWQQLRREAHSLKGDSRSVGVETIETLAHGVEEIFVTLSHQPTAFTPQLSGLLSRGLDAIGLLLQEAVTAQPSGVDTTEVFNQLMASVLQLKEPQPEITLTAIEDEELREIYKIASQDRLQKLEAGLLHLEKHPDNHTILEQLLREAHSFKGDSRSVGAEHIEALIHQVEEILLGIKCQQMSLTPQLFDCLYQGLDASEKLVREVVTGQLTGVDSALILKQLMDAVSASTIQEERIETPETSFLPVTSPPQDTPSIDEPYHIDSIRVQTRDLDALMTQAEELTVTRISIAHTTAELEELVNLWEDWKAFRRKRQSLESPSLGTNPYEDRLEKMIDSLRTSAQENSSRLNLIAGELGEKIRTLRLLPLSTIFQFFPRVVRDLARQQSKPVELIVEGGETTADKRILEDIKDSLMHIIRNAIDHGIETLDERKRLGKPPVATIWLKGYQQANNIAIEVTDDGRGLDIETIKQTAIKRKLYSVEELESMTPSQIYSLIFAPGFSTRTFITEISGRGIGLDVVRSNVERLKGNIQIESTPGQGCTFRLQLSTSLASINVMLLSVQGIIHALSVEFVQTTLLVSQDEILTFEGREIIIWEGQEIPVGNLADLLELSNSPAYVSAAKVESPKSDLKPCIVLQVGEERAGFFVDRLLDTQEVVLKPVSQVLKRVRNISGSTILGTGDVCMILNPPDLLKSLHNPNLFTVSLKPRKVAHKKPVILLVEDSIYVRTQEQRLLENAGYEVVIAVDGVDGYNKLRTRDFDAVVSDVEMPHLDGFSLTAKIRRHLEYKELPIILVTTLNSDEDKKRGADAGADAYIIKGKFNQDFLLETLGRLA